MSQFLNNAEKALRDGRWDDYEELWLDALESDAAPLPDYLRAARRAAEEGQGVRAGSVLALLAPKFENLSGDKKREFYETLVTCCPRDRDHRDSLLAIYKELHGDKPGYETYIRTADLKRNDDPSTAIESFLNMVRYMPGSFVFHRSGWGVGEIKEVLGLEGAAIIDFIEKPGHRVQVDAIPDICEQLGENDFRVLAWKFQDRLANLVENDPCEVIKSVLRTSARPLALARIREQLVGKAVPAGSWTKWWTKARAQVKKDPEIAVTAKRTPEYFLLEGPEGVAASLERRLEKQSLKNKLRILREATAEAKDDDERDAVIPFHDRLAKDLRLLAGTPELLLEVLLFLRSHDHEGSDFPTVHELLSRTEHPGDVINLLGRQEDQQAVIDLLRSQDPQGWEELHADFFLRADDGPRRYLIDLMRGEGRLDEIDLWAKEIHRVPKNAPMFFLWLVRKVGLSNMEHIPCLAGTKGIDLYLRAISLLNDYTVRFNHDPNHELALIVKRYKHHLGGRPFKLLIELVKNEDLAPVRNVYHAISAAEGFSSTNRQGLLAAILREQPTLLSSDRPRTAAIDDSVIYSTDVGIEKKRAELEDIRNEKLPAVFKLIGDAAAFGDLSENAEFTSAIEERENLNRRAMEIQSQLDVVRRIDPALASLERVTLGSRVALVNLDTEEQQTYSLLGPWDGGPDEGVLSYMSPLGRALLDKAPNVEFDVELPDGTGHYVVKSIERHESAAV